MTITVNIHEAKTQLSRLLEQVKTGREVIIAKAGRPIAKLQRLEAPTATRSLGFMAGQGVLGADLKRDFESEVSDMSGT
jgi:prevent-host-death family protein